MKNTKYNTSDAAKVATEKIHVLLFGTEPKSIESLRATLEVAGHTVTHEKTALGVENRYVPMSLKPSLYQPIQNLP